MPASFFSRQIAIDHERMLSCQVWKRSKISIVIRFPKINTAFLWHSLLNVTSQSLLHGYLARALVLTDVLPPFFLGRMDCGAVYWWRRTTFWKIYTCFYIFKFPPNITCFDRLVPLYWIFQNYIRKYIKIIQIVFLLIFMKK